MDVHVHVGINLQVTAVHHLYLAKALGCIVNSDVHGHGLAGEMDWKVVKKEEGRQWSVCIMPWSFTYIIYMH